MTEQESREVVRRVLQGPDLAQLVQSIRDLPALIATAAQPCALNGALQSHVGMNRAEASSPTAVPEGREELERQLEGLWRQVLGAEQIGREQDFFRQGRIPCCAAASESCAGAVPIGGVVAGLLFRSDDLGFSCNHSCRAGVGGARGSGDRARAARIATVAECHGVGLSGWI